RLIAAHKLFDAWQRRPRGLRNERRIGEVLVFVAAATVPDGWTRSRDVCDNSDEDRVVMAPDPLGRTFDSKAVDSLGDGKIVVLVEPGDEFLDRNAPRAGREVTLRQHIAFERRVIYARKVGARIREVAGPLISKDVPIDPDVRIRKNSDRNAG